MADPNVKLSTAEVAALLQCTESHVLALIRKGTLPSDLTAGAVAAFVKGARTAGESAPSDLMWYLYASESEVEGLQAKGMRIEDPRKKAEERTARRMANAQAELEKKGITIEDLLAGM